MTKPQVEVSINLSGLINYQKGIEQGLNSRTRNPIQKALKQWGFRFRAFVQNRFDRFSKGGGNWAPLAASTVRSRRKRSSTILRDTGVLFNALAPVFKGQPGAIESAIPFGIKVGFGGPGVHPAGVPIAKLAMWHHTGAGRYPARKIIVKPPQSVINKMAEDMNRALKILADQNTV